MFKNILVIALLVFSLPAFADDLEKKQRPEKRLISVQGSSSLRAAPDKTTIRFAIENLDKDAKAARVKNDKTAAIVLNSIRKAGVPHSKIKVESFNINEKFEYNNKKRERESLGYNAVRDVKVVVLKSDLDEKTSLSDKVSQLVALITEGGSNRISSVDFGLDDNSEIKKEALKKAVANARDKAGIMLEAVSAKLGAVQTINESYVNSKPIYQRKLSMMMAADVESSAGNPDAYSEGELDISASVSAVFEIE